MWKQIALAVVLMAIAGCSKPVSEAPKVQVVVPSVVAGPTTELEKMGAVKMVPAPVAVEPVKVVAPVVKKKTYKTKVKAQKFTDADATALIEAEMICGKALNQIVDIKIDGDIKLGTIRDFGSPVTFLRGRGVCPPASMKRG